MEASLISQVRRFNRTVTQRVGALDDEFLARHRPLGQARLLWEIGPDGADVRALRARLDLDSGYLSRLLRALQADGLIDVDASGRGRPGAHGPPHPPRPGRAGRTRPARGRRGRIDPRPAQRVPADPAGQRDGRGRAAPDGVGGRGRRVPSRCPAARACLRAYVAELGRRFDAGFDPARSLPAGDQDMSPPAGLFLVATLHSEAVGCGGLMFHVGAPAKVRRMWVAPSVRGLGVGRRLLAELEAHAAARGVTVLRLETNGALAEAISLYRSSGYREVAPFSDEPYAHHWFEKTLDPNVP